MAAIAINNLSTSRNLDHKAMARIQGAAGAPWVYGWIRPFVEASASFGATVNLYQTNNIYVADQMNNQFQTIAINNSASGANINVNAKQLAGNAKLV